MLAQQLLNGLLLGSVYALFAMGFTLVFGVMNILNLAHGAIFACGAFATLYAVRLSGLGLWGALPLAIVTGAVVSLAVDFVAFRPLRRRGADDFGAIVSSIGASLILISVLQQISDARILTFPFGTFPAVVYRIAGMRITLLQVAVLCTTALAIGSLLLYLYRTSFGRQLRTVAVSERTAVLLGINPAFVYGQVFLCAGALAGLAGLIIGIMYNSVHALMGEGMLLKAFVVVVLGGLGSLTGAVLSGLLIGLLQTMIATYISSQLSDAILFAFLLVVLLVYPTGLFKGLRSEARVVRS